MHTKNRKPILVVTLEEVASGMGFLWCGSSTGVGRERESPKVQKFKSGGRGGAPTRSMLGDM